MLGVVENEDEGCVQTGRQLCLEEACASRGLLREGKERSSGTEISGIVGTAHRIIGP